jgi:putative phosphoribosyl transferase
MIFRDRSDAGRRLAEALGRFRDQQPIVLGLPRGGVVVAAEIATALNAPLDVLVVRKLGTPGAEEFAIGAVAPGATLLNRELIVRFGIPRDYLMRIIGRETEELRRREEVYRNGSPPPDVRGRTVILVDDGLATGATAQAAIESLRRRQPRRVVFAAPVCSPEGAEALRRVADEVECLVCPQNLRAVGEWYEDFSATSDAEVIRCLGSARSLRASA